MKYRSFNEAAGFTQRKRDGESVPLLRAMGFNEAAGFTQRKPASTLSTLAPTSMQLQ